MRSFWPVSMLVTSKFDTPSLISSFLTIKNVKFYSINWNYQILMLFHQMKIIIWQTFNNFICKRKTKNFQIFSTLNASRDFDVEHKLCECIHFFLPPLTASCDTNEKKKAPREVELIGRQFFVFLFHSREK